MAILFVELRMGSLRDAAMREAESLTGAHVAFRAIRADGLRGLRVDDPIVSFDSTGGIHVALAAPVAYIYLDLAQVVHGRVAINRIQIDKAAIQVIRPPGQFWKRNTAPPDLSSLAHPPNRPFRILGRHCRLDITDALNANRLSVSDCSFDVSRLTDAPYLNAHIKGDFANTPDKRFQLDARFASLDDFDIQLRSSLVTVDDINPFLPPSKHVLQAGTASPILRLDGYPGGICTASLISSFKGLSVRDQPDWIEPASGSLTVLATYNLKNRTLVFNAATIKSAQLDASIGGSIAFDQFPPRLDLNVTATRVSLAKLVERTIQNRIEPYGRLEFAFDTPPEGAIEVRGNIQNPVIFANAHIETGRVSFKPKQPLWPAGALELESIEAAWNSKTNAPQASFHVIGGHISYPPAGVTAKNVSARVTYADKHATVDALNAEITGYPFVGSLRYDFPTHTAKFTADGTIAGIEHTVLAHAIHNTSLAGSATIHAHGEKHGSTYTVQADVDATQTQINYQWWFKKPPGAGATGTVNASIIPYKSAHLKTNLIVACTPVKAQLNFAYVKPKMKLQSVKATSDNMDLAAISRCLALPYTITATTGSDGFYEWTRKGLASRTTTLHGGGLIDDLTLLPKGATIPSRYHHARVEVTATKGAHPKGALKVHAAYAVMPPFKKKWFVPLLTDPKLLALYPPVHRPWSYDLSADALEVPPWKGAHFTGTATKFKKHFAFDKFGADIGHGHLDGAYSSNAIENTYTLSAYWHDVPAKYFLDHLGFPRLLEGAMSGQVTYSVNRNDPSTRQGSGHFEVADGQFSADILSKLLEEHRDEDLRVLPPSLKFHQLSADLEFDRKVIRTPSFHLSSAGVDLTGHGQFAPKGNMNYTINASITPDTANKIPALKEYFNTQGHRISKQNLNLTFNVSGPTLNPTGRLAKMPPPTVTLLNGALQVTNEAIKVIDIPRKILVDLLKIGGGIVGGSPPL